MSEDIHEIYAIKYGHHSRRSSVNFIDRDTHDVLQPLDFFVWAIVGPAGTIILDTGFDEAMGKKRLREMTRPVREGLAALGVAADSVKDVIISHLHYDHCGNHELFPQARSPAGSRNGLCDRALHVPPRAAPAVRDRRRCVDGAQGISRPRRLP